jgi:sulfate/thiosulfate transport system substrate-binding protein
MLENRKPALGLRHAAALALTATVLAACGGASDVAGKNGPSNGKATLTSVAYSVPEPGLTKDNGAITKLYEGATG